MLTTSAFIHTSTVKECLRDTILQRIVSEINAIDTFYPMCRILGLYSERIYDNKQSINYYICMALSGLIFVFIYICLQLAVGYESCFSIFRFSYEANSFNNRTTHVRTEKKQVIIAEIIIKFEFQFIDEQAYIKHAFKSMHTIRKQQHSNPPIKTTATPHACSRNSLSHLFPFSAFPLAEIGKLELCHYHQYLYELRQRILHQYDPICPLVVLQ